MALTSGKVNYYRLALRDGRRYRMELSEDDRLSGTGGGSFGYLAAVFDSENENNTWHRLKLEGVFRECKYEITAAASDADIRSMMNRKDASPGELLRMLKEQSWTRKVNTDDMLLHSIRGRYLWIFISVAGAGQNSNFRIEGFQVEFPRKSFAEYLPEIYQEPGRDTFFERYMAVLQSLYEDLEQEVAKIPAYLDYETAPDENLPLFAGWTGDWAAGRGFSAEQMRDMFRNLKMIQSGRGTRQVLCRMIRMFTGKNAVVVEYFKWHDWMRYGASLEEIYEKLFGKNEDTFTVLIRLSDEEGQKGISGGKLERLLEDYIPLGMHCNLVFLKKNSRMDSHCYLDHNGCLATPAAADTSGFGLDGNFILS